MHASVLARATARSNLQCMDCLTRNNNVFLCLLISFSCAIDTLFLLDFRLYENDSVV